MPPAAGVGLVVARGHGYIFSAKGLGCKYFEPCGVEGVLEVLQPFAAALEAVRA